LPIAVGFGVKTPEQASAIGKGADGVVVGSALVNAIESSLGPGGVATGKTASAALNLVGNLSQALRNG
jgi:tryptophan synthase alpha chain